jgi:drug/metabolite transporter (DMT)-like permease
MSIQPILLSFTNKMASKHQGSLFISLMVIFEIISQYFIQKSVDVPTTWYKNTNLWLGLFGQLIMSSLYYLVLKSGYSLAIANTLIDGGGALGIILLGYFIFKQKISRKQIIAILITMIGVIMLGLSE